MNLGLQSPSSVGITIVVWCNQVFVTSSSALVFLRLDGMSPIQLNQQSICARLRALHSTPVPKPFEPPIQYPEAAQRPKVAPGLRRVNPTITPSQPKARERKRRPALDDEAEQCRTGAFGDDGELPLLKR